jgi:tyrosyl-tRNA synthetase
VEEVIDKQDLEAKLNSKKKLRVKLGIDPTSPNIHIGRAVVLWKLRAFQELGHKVVFIVGDFTGLIGDTSDKESERPMLEEKIIKQNLKSYFAQAGKIIDAKKAEFHYNSKWLKKLGFKDIGHI